MDKDDEPALERRHGNSFPKSGKPFLKAVQTANLSDPQTQQHLETKPAAKRVIPFRYPVELKDSAKAYLITLMESKHEGSPAKLFQYIKFYLQKKTIRKYLLIQEI